MCRRCLTYCLFAQHVTTLVVLALCSDSGQDRSGASKALKPGRGLAPQRRSTESRLPISSVYLAVGIEAGVPPALMAYMLLVATNFFSCITPQGSSGNVIFVGSGYLKSGEVYRNGALVTFANLLIYGVVGTLWILAVF